jgi:predicted anti-sigma-YlaC factor YlaD
MELSSRMVCQELLLDLICYEMCRGRLSTEMEYLLEKHLEQCPSCRDRIAAFRKMLQEPMIVRNFG